MKQTIAYYDQNAKFFASQTVDISFTEIQDRFLTHLPPNGLILDFGCGSGRDTRYFLSKGFLVDAIDGSGELCKIATANTGIEVRQMFFSELDTYDKYDGIWACASILHLPKDELKSVFEKMLHATKSGGYIYISFKYGEFEGYKQSRFFTCFTEQSFDVFFGDYPDVKIVDSWVSADARPGRENEKWLNAIIQKTDMI